MTPAGGAPGTAGAGYRAGACQQSDWCGPGSHCLCVPAARPAEPTGELREQVARWLWSADDNLRGPFSEHADLCRVDADDLIAQAPALASLLAKIRAVEELADELMTERSLVPGIARRAAAERIRRALDAS